MLVGYARVSTRDQSSAIQFNALQAAGCERIFEEKMGGAKRERPELASALNYMRSGDTLVVWRLDRLARSTRQLIDTIEDLDRRQIGFCCLSQDGMDTTTSGGRLIFTIFGAIAEFERDLIRERTRVGLDAARARGRKGGRPPSLSASDLAKAKAMLRDPALTVEEVAHTLGVGQATLYRHLPGGRRAAEEVIA